jgi:RecG-like helicase
MMAEHLDHEPAPAPATNGRKKGALRPASAAVPGTQPIASLRWRTRARVAGRVKTIRVQPLSEVPTIEAVVVDDSGEAITFVFLGRRSIAGLRSGTRMVAEGMVGKHKGKLAMINPSYEVLVSASAEESE